MTRTIHSFIRIVGISLSAGLLAGLFSSCALLNNTASEADSSQATTENGSLTGTDLACDTPTHISEIVWSNGEPLITLTQKPGETILNQAEPVAILSNPDGSRTYGYQTDRTVFTRFYLDGTCLIQALDDQDNITVEAFGQTSIVNPSGEDNTTTPTTNGDEPIDEPIAAATISTPPSEPVSNSEEALIATAPNPASLSLLCSGAIQNDVDFTAYFNGESGFSRVEFLPRASSSNTPLTSTLSYSGENSAGQALWRGSVSAMADVTLVHLSTSAVKAGDRVSVGYDGRWGQAICR